MKRSPRARRLCGSAAVLLLLGFSPTAHAQSAGSDIHGIVVDPSGAALPGATVTLGQPATGTERTLVTDAHGSFRTTLLPVGVYDVAVSAPPFQPRTWEGLVITVGQTVTLRLDLTLPGIADSVDVIGTAPALDTSRSAVASTIDDTAVHNLPVNGRNFIDFVLLTPGVTRDVRSGDISFAGQRGSLNSLIVDGVDDNNTFAAQSIGRSGSGRAPYQFSQDAVKEFQVNSNSFSAEYGRAGGAVINVVTKSGSNDVRGSLFEFYRDKALNATNAINRRRGLPKSPYHYHQFGGTIGGPLRVGRDFFFANYDGQRNTQPNPVFLNLAPQVPSDADTLAAIARLRPLALSWERRLDQDVFLIKTDHQIGARHRLSFRYNHQAFTGAGFETAGTQNAWEHSGDSLVNTRSLSATWSAQLGGRAFNEVRLHYARDRQTGTANTEAPEAIVQDSGRRVIVLGRNFFSPRQTLLDRAQIANTLAWARARHMIKAGFDLQFDRIDNDFPSYFSGSYSFASLAEFARGTATSYRQDFAGPDTSGPSTRPDIQEYSFFVQDEWRPAPHVTLNAGVRYDVMRAAQPPIRNEDPDLAAADIDTSRLNADTNNWGPRLGVVWNPRGSRYVLRAGGGLFYGRTPAIVATAAEAYNGINVLSLTFTGADVPRYPYRFVEAPRTGTRILPNLFYVDRDRADPRLLHLNTAWEWQFAPATTMAVTYLHVAGRDLPRSIDRNLGTLRERTFTIAGSNETIAYHHFGSDDPFSRFDRVVAFESNAESTYNGLTVDLVRRFTGDTQLRVAYTLGKVVDTNPDATAVATDDGRFASNPVDFDADRTVGDNDRRHRLVASGVYVTTRRADLLPGVVRAFATGWTFSAIFTAESGRPYSARMVDVDLNNDGNRFNDLAPGTRRNAFRLPAIVTLDPRIAREIPLRGSVRAQLIWEAFNLLNRANFNAAVMSRYTVRESTLVPTTAFGEPQSSAGERIMQLALRVTF
jgi:outer membrane receptor protein involved in Fe transport